MSPFVLNRFEAFVAQYLSDHLKLLVAPAHRIWADHLVDQRQQYLVINSGRGMAKTTWFSRFYPVYWICEGNDTEMQVISRSSGSTGTATKIMAWIKREFEKNDLLAYDYGIKKGDVWGQEHIQVVRAGGHTVDLYSIGKRSSVRGSRGPTLIDDPQDRADCRSETVLEADKEWFLTDVLPVILKDQRLLFIGTPISPLSLLATVEALPGFTCIKTPAEDPPYSGHSAWPEQYPDEFLAERQAQMGQAMYAAEYLCEPMVSGNPVWKPDWFKSYDPNTQAFQMVRQNGLFVVTAGDTAESKSSQADYTAWVTLGATLGVKNPDIYVLDVRREHWSTKDGAEQPFLIQDQWHQHQTVVESRVSDKFGGDAMTQEIRAKEKLYGKSVNLYPVKPVADKVTRAMQVQSIAQEGRVYVNRLDKAQQELLSELTMFTGSQNFHDDIHDAFVTALAAIKTRGATASAPIRSGLEGAWV